MKHTPVCRVHTCAYGHAHMYVHTHLFSMHTFSMHIPASPCRPCRASFNFKLEYVAPSSAADNARAPLPMTHSLQVIADPEASLIILVTEFLPGGPVLSATRQPQGTARQHTTNGSSSRRQTEPLPESLARTYFRQATFSPQMYLRKRHLCPSNLPAACIAIICITGTLRKFTGTLRKFRQQYLQWPTPRPALHLSHITAVSV